VTQPRTRGPVRHAAGIADAATGATALSRDSQPLGGQRVTQPRARGGVRHAAGLLTQPQARLLWLVTRSRWEARVRRSRGRGEAFATLRDRWLWLVTRSHLRGAKSVSGESDVSRDSSYNVYLHDMPIVLTP
jgi:hypothetical protein